MARFRKKPVVIEAVQFLGTHDEIVGGGAYFQGFAICNSDGVHLSIPTLEGQMRCNVGDWLITGVKGERYPCKPDIFAATYEAVGA